MVSTLKVNKIQIPNSDSDIISLDATTGNITINKVINSPKGFNKQYAVWSKKDFLPWFMEKVFLPYFVFKR